MDQQTTYIIRKIVREKSELGPGCIVYQSSDKYSAQHRFNELQVSEIRNSKLYDLLQTLSDERILMVSAYYEEQFGKPLVKEHPDGDIEFLFDTTEFQLPDQASDKQILELINKGKIITHLFLEFEKTPVFYTLERNPVLTFINSGNVFRMPDTSAKWYYHSEKEALDNTIRLLELAIRNYTLKYIETTDLQACSLPDLHALKTTGLIDYDLKTGMIHINEKLTREETRSLLFAIHPTPFLVKEVSLEKAMAEHTKHLS